jgi:hypothetical protein
LRLVAFQRAAADQRLGLLEQVVPHGLAGGDGLQLVALPGVLGLGRNGGQGRQDDESWSAHGMALRGWNMDKRR